MPDETGRILEPRERTVQPRPEFREELWDRLRREALESTPAWRLPGGPPWRRPNVRRIATIAAALLLGVAAVAIVLPLQRDPVRTLGDIPTFGAPPAFRATFERRIPQTSVQNLVDALAGERLIDPPAVGADEIVRFRLTVSGEQWRIDWLSDSILEGGDREVAQLLSQLSPDRSPGSYWIGGGGTDGRFSASTGTFTNEEVFGGSHPLDLLSWDGTDAAEAFWEEACAPGSLVANERVAGRDTHHVACGPWDAWIDAQHGVLLRLELHDPEGLGVPVPGVIGVLSGETLAAIDIDLEVEPSPGTFDASVPSDAAGPTGSGVPVATGLEIGDPVPRFELPTIDGGTIDLADLRGRRVAVYAWASWCEPCLGTGEPKLLQVLDGVARRAGDELAVVTMASNDEPQDDARLTEGLGSIVVALDEEHAWTRTLGSDAIPLLVLIDPEGNLAGAYLAGMSAEDLRAVLDAFAASRPLPLIGGDVVSQVP